MHTSASKPPRAGASSETDRITARATGHDGELEARSKRPQGLTSTHQGL